MSPQEEEPLHEALRRVSTVEQLALLLRRLKARADLSYRTIETRSRTRGGERPLSRGVIDAVINGKRLPKKENVVELAIVCGDEEHLADWQSAWERVAEHHRILHPSAPGTHRWERDDLQARYDHLRARCDEQDQEIEDLRRRLAAAETERKALERLLGEQKAALAAIRPPDDVYRVDQLRRTFSPRRFGSGYDPMQVDRLFEAILQAMTGQGTMPVAVDDLDRLQFGLVPMGYFEAEVEAALREVKSILTARWTTQLAHHGQSSSDA